VGLLLAATAAVACGGSRYLYGPLGAVVVQPKPKNCDFSLLDKLPDQAYDPLGVFAPVDIVVPKVPSTDAAFKKSVAAQVCEAGGDAVVTERDDQGRYVRGTVIRFK
jgi:hypothetical protein